MGLMLQVLLPLGVQLAFITDRGQEVLDYVIFPVADLTVTFHFLILIIAIVDVQSRVVSEITERYFIEPLKEHMVSRGLILSIALRQTSILPHVGLLLDLVMDLKVILAVKALLSGWSNFALRVDIILCDHGMRLNINLEMRR